jgi:small subunit ribosomal protein S21
MLVTVRDNNVDQALRALKKKLQREGIYRELKLRQHFEKPSEKRAREHAAAVSRAQSRSQADRERSVSDPYGRCTVVDRVANMMRVIALYLLLQLWTRHG